MDPGLCSHFAAPICLHNPSQCARPPAAFQAGSVASTNSKSINHNKVFSLDHWPYLSKRRNSNWRLHPLMLRKNLSIINEPRKLRRDFWPSSTGRCCVAFPGCDPWDWWVEKELSTPLHRVVKKRFERGGTGSQTRHEEKLDSQLLRPPQDHHMGLTRPVKTTTPSKHSRHDKSLMCIVITAPQ